MIKNFTNEIILEPILDFGRSHDHTYHKYTNIDIKSTDDLVIYILGTPLNYI